MNKESDVRQFIEMSVGGHPGSIYSANQAGVPEAFARLAGDADLRKHRLVMGKTRDGMSGHYGIATERRVKSCATGLLASLMRRI